MAIAETMVTRDTMATGEAMGTGEAIFTGETDLQCVRQCLMSGLVAVAGHLASSSLILIYISCLRVGPLLGHLVNNGHGVRLYKRTALIGTYM